MFADLACAEADAIASTQTMVRRSATGVICFLMIESSDRQVSPDNVQPFIATAMTF
jgi:hypothetical protein